MKPFLSLIFLLLFSCSSDDNFNQPRNLENLPQKWQLISLSTGLANQTLTGDELPFQETYLLNENKTFKKTRVDDGEILEAEGTFIYEVRNGNTFLVLTFSEYNGIIVNCTQELSEILLYDVERDVLESTSQLCDGGTFTYQIF